MAILLSGATLAAEVSFDLKKVLEEKTDNESVPVIISYRSEANPFLLRKRLRTEERRFRRSIVPRTLKADAGRTGNRIVELVKSLDGKDTRDLWIANSVAADLTPAAIELLLSDPDIIQIRSDGLVDSPFPMAGEALAPEWNIDAVGVPALWQAGYLGASVVIAAMDTGVDALHPELAANYRGGDNSWFDPYGEHATPYDRTGHGTQVMGIMVGGDGSGASIGIAPQATWIAVKIFNDAGSATESAIHAAFQWLLDPDGDPLTDDAPDVVSQSWSFADPGGCNSAFQADIEALKAADIAMVFSAGNFGPDASSGASPGNNPGAFSAGAVDINSDVSSFSSRGPSTCDGSLMPDIVAPGDAIQTTDLSFGGNAFYVSVSGTSFAAPHIVGVLALLRDAIPPASVDELEAALTASATDIGEPGPDQDSGYGLVNAAAALDMLAYPVDVDGDGYGPSLDCNDNDITIYPGAPEIGRDGIDQDCNGYDLTIKIHQAVYSHDGGSLRLRITSGLYENAALEVVGVGPLEYRHAYNDWHLSGGSVDGYANPVITVRGIEGDVEVEPRKPTPRR
ncbi:MAG: S8 family serine peptidase [Woeseiaceae bacterium]